MLQKLLSIIFFVAITSGAVAQDVSLSDSDVPDPKIAFLKSLVLPGWGHHYVDRSDWRRGQYHIAAEATLLLSYVGLSIHSNNLQYNWFTYAQDEAGVEIEERERSFQLAVGDFNNLEAYNDYQERSRNWDLLYANVPSNRWQWSDLQARETYGDLRDRFESIDQQLPALLSLMVVNRLISAVSAYNRAQKKRETTTTSLYLAPSSRRDGIVAHLRINF